MRKGTIKQYNRNLNYDDAQAAYRTGSLYSPVYGPTDADDVETIELGRAPRGLRPRRWSHVYQGDSDRYFQYSRESSSGDALDAKPHYTDAAAHTHTHTTRYVDSDSSGDDYNEYSSREPAILMYCNARCVLEELSGLHIPPAWSGSDSPSPATSRDRLKQKPNRVQSPFPNNYTIPKMDLSKGWTLPTVTEVKEAHTSVSRELIEKNDAVRIRRLCNWLSGDKENERPMRMTQSAKEARQTQANYPHSYRPIVVHVKDVATQTTLTLNDLENIRTADKGQATSNADHPITQTPKAGSVPARRISTNPFEADYEKRYIESDVYRGTELATGRKSYMDSKGTNSPVVTCLPTLSFGLSRTGSELTNTPVWWRLWRCLACCRIK